MSITLLLFNLVLTILVEGALCALLTRNKKIVYDSFLCNLLTNPVLNLLLLVCIQQWGITAYMPSLIVLELFAVVGEACIYRGLARMRLSLAVLLSLALNASSLCLGLIAGRVAVLLG